MESITNINLNMQAPNHAVVYATQGDVLTRKVCAALSDGATPWAIPASAQALIRYMKPDGTWGAYDSLEDDSAAWSTSSPYTSVTITFAGQVLTVAGTVFCQIIFYNSSDEQLSTFSFRVEVQAAAVADEEIVSSDYFNVLTSVLAEMISIRDQAAAFVGSPLVAEFVSDMTNENKIYVYTGSETGYTAGHWYYYDNWAVPDPAWVDGGVYNSTALSTDTTLTIAGKAADAKATGDAIGDLKSAMNDEVHFIDDGDYFNYKVAGSLGSNGKWQQPDASASHVMIPVVPGDSVMISANNNQAAIYAVVRSFEATIGGYIDFSTAAGFTTRVVLTKATSLDTPLTMPSDAAYLVFTALVSNNNYLPKAVTINGYNVRNGYRKELKSLLDKFQYYYRTVRAITSEDNIDTGLTETGLYTIGYNVVPSGSIPYIRHGVETLYLENISNASMISLMQRAYSPDTGAMACRFKVSGNWTPWYYNDDKQLKGVQSFTISPSPVVDANLDPLPVTDGEELRILTYNVGRYNDGKATAGFPASIINTKLRDLRNFLYYCNADIICLQEDTTTCSQESTWSPHEYIYAPIYQRMVTLGGCSVYTRCEMLNKGSRSIGNGRSMSWALINKFGKNIMVVSAHPSYDTSAHRAEEYASIFNWLDTYWNDGGGTPQLGTFDVCLICGDMNSSESADRGELASLCTTYGYKLGNGGYLGWLYTTPRLGTLDNVIVSGATITDFDVCDDWYNMLYSDHFPVLARVMIPDTD